MKLGQTVYLKTDREQLPRFVTAIIKRPGVVIYELSHETSCSNHFDFEITHERNQLTEIGVRDQ